MTPQQALDEARARLGPNGQTRIRISGGKISYVVGLRDGLAFRVLGSGASYAEAFASAFRGGEAPSVRETKEGER